MFLNGLQSLLYKMRSHFRRFLLWPMELWNAVCATSFWRRYVFRHIRILMQTSIQKQCLDFFWLSVHIIRWLLSRFWVFVAALSALKRSWASARTTDQMILMMRNANIACVMLVHTLCCTTRSCQTLQCKLLWHHHLKNYLVVLHFSSESFWKKKEQKSSNLPHPLHLQQLLQTKENPSQKWWT